MLSGQSQPAPDQPQGAITTGIIPQTLEMDGESYAYSVYVPPDYSPNRAWPVILFLHGSGERGTDGYRQTQVGIGPALRLHSEHIPAIVVMPQCRPDQRWLGPMTKLALRCLEETSRQYVLDKDRMYLAGLSLGGAGVWVLGAELTDQVAALVPICGFGDVREADKLAKIPTWCFHGAKDAAVPVEKSREMVAAIREAGGDIQYTEYPDGGHNVWDAAFGDEQMWKWLFAQRRSNATEKTESTGDTAEPATSNPDPDPVNPEQP